MRAIPKTESARFALPEHTRIRLRHGLPKAALAKGAAGTIVHVYEQGGYEVEFIAGRTRPLVLTLEPAGVEECRGE